MGLEGVSTSNCENVRGRARVIAVIIARNEKNYIRETIASLKNQTMSIDIALVNDGSTDGTRDIARDMGCVVIDLPYHEESYVGRPELAERVNAGLKLAREGDYDYVLIVGADHPLPPDYVRKLVSRMEANSKLVVASGRIKGEPYDEMVPRGSGRIVRTSFWKRENNLQYPVAWGWEAWLYLKVLERGYETRCFGDIVTETKRTTSLRKAGYLGKAMYALGYNWKYALGRCLLTFLRSPKAGISMFWGWARHKDVERLDIARWVSMMQKKRFWKKVRNKLGF